MFLTTFPIFKSSFYVIIIKKKRKRDVFMKEERIVRKQDIDHVDYNVVSSNTLILSSSLLSINEAKIIYATIAQVLQSDKKLYWCKFTPKQLQEICNLNKDNLYRDLKRLNKSLMQKTFTVEKLENNNGETKKKFATYHWLYGIEYSNDYWSIRLHDELIPFVLFLDKDFTSDKLRELTSYNSYFSFKLHDVFTMYFNKQTSKMSNLKKIETKIRFSFSVEEIKTILGIQDKYKNRFNNFMSKVIVPAIEEINNARYYNVSYEVERKNKKADRLVFFLSLGEKSSKYKELTSKIKNVSTLDKVNLPHLP